MKVIIYANGGPGMKRTLQFQSGTLDEFIEELRAKVDFAFVGDVTYLDSDLDEYILLEDPSEFNLTQITRIKITTKKNGFCPLHSDEQLKYFCSVHNTLCCSDCVIVGSHKTCREAILSLQDGRAHCSAYLESINIPTAQENLNTNLKNIEQRIKQAQLFNETIEAKLEKDFEQLVNALRVTFDSMKVEVSTKSKVNLQDIVALQSTYQESAKVLQQDVSTSSDYEYLEWTTALLSTKQLDPDDTHPFTEYAIEGMQQLAEEIQNLQVSCTTGITEAMLPVHSLISTKINPPFKKLSSEKHLIGAPHQGWAIGGFLMNVTAKSDILFTGLSVHSRTESVSKVALLYKRGIVRETGNREEWTELVPKQEFQCKGATEATQIFKEGEILIHKGETISLIVDNIGAPGNGEIVCNNTKTQTAITDEFVELSKAVLLDRAKNTFCLYGNGSHVGHFCGVFHYSA
mmetsp:Transcript_22032/g.28129  ORF Transcript_22032/g.28129 Transcript_22032/m.28129 type:complete len:460 (-) Transcript_22032:48-1427(-)